MVEFGKIPDKEFVTGPLGEMSLKVGIIKRVDEVHMKADIYVITGGYDQVEIDLTQGMCGPRSFWGGIPEVNSTVILGFRRRHKQITEAMILGYIPTGLRSGQRFDPFSPISTSGIDPEDASDIKKLFGSTTRYKTLSLKPGDVGGMSSSGAELVLSKDVRLINRAGDLFELRDSDRTLLSQAIHRVESDSAAYFYSGPVRRSGMNLPPEIFKSDGKTLKTEQEGYFGGSTLQKTHPRTGGPSFSNASGVLLGRVLDEDEFPPVTYSNGSKAFYVSGAPGTNFEDPENGGIGTTYTERRLEIRHVTDLTQEVRGDIDGFGLTRPVVYIENVLGTYVGNDPYGDPGNYARVMKPRIFDSFGQRAAPKSFRMEEVNRTPPKDESFTKAAAYLLKIRPPKAVEDTSFALAVNKEGKVFLNVPGSKDEDLPDAKNVSVEANLEGALKFRVGKSSPSGLSLHGTFEGGVFLDVGSDSHGNAIQIAYHSAVKSAYKGVPNTDDVALSEDVQGDKEQTVSGNASSIIGGRYRTRVDGGYILEASRMNINAINGFTGNYGELNQLVSGKSQYNYAQQVLETIALGGRVSTILAGGYIGSVAAGAYTQSVLAGAIAWNCPAGAYTVNVGAGALSLSTGVGAVSLSTGVGAMSLSAGVGIIAMTAGLAINLTAAIAVAITSPQVLLGAPVAPLGVCRGLPLHPPGSPSLDWITNLPLQGSALIRAI